MDQQSLQQEIQSLQEKIKTSRSRTAPRAQEHQPTKPPNFGEQDRLNSRLAPLAKVGANYSEFMGVWTPHGTAPTIQIGVIGSHSCIIHIHQSPNKSDIGVTDVYEYTTPNKHMIIQRTLAFGGYYKVTAINMNDEDMKKLHLITTLVNHPAIKQGIIIQ